LLFMLPPCSIHADTTEFQRRSGDRGRRSGSLVREA
jgi:hypothetical protein